MISKLRRDSPLFEKYEGKQKPKGPPRKYGEQLNYEAMPIKYLKKTEVEGQIIVNYYQGVFLHKSFGMPLKCGGDSQNGLEKTESGICDAVQQR